MNSISFLSMSQQINLLRESGSAQDTNKSIIRLMPSTKQQVAHFYLGRGFLCYELTAMTICAPKLIGTYLLEAPNTLAPRLIQGGEITAYKSHCRDEEIDLPTKNLFSLRTL